MGISKADWTPWPQDPKKVSYEYFYEHVRANLWSHCTVRDASFYTIGKIGQRIYACEVIECPRRREAIEHTKGKICGTDA